MKGKKVIKLTFLIIGLGFFMTISTLSFGAFIMFFMRDPHEYLFEVGVFPLFSVVAPLICIWSVNRMLNKAVLNVITIYFIVTSMISIVLVILAGDFFIFSILFYLFVLIWSGYACTLSRKVYQHLKRNGIRLSQVSSMILATILFIRYIICPLRAVDLGITPAINGTADACIGIILIGIIFISFLASHLRANAYITFFMYAIWYLYTIESISRNFQIFYHGFAGTMTVIASISVLLMTNAGISGGLAIRTTSILRKQHKSVFWGPLAKNFLSVFWTNERAKIKTALKELPVKKVIMLLAIIGSACIPGILFLTNNAPVPIKITPKDYDIRFNFWASENINTTYSQIEKQEMNEHYVNLNIAMYLTREKMPILIDFERQMPNITYRITVIPDNISDLYSKVVELTEILMEYEANGTIDQWRGFAFDIEGH
ncbi:MAG: hypothetical protein ACTSXP_16610 [Promethearchaeota archaeon]